MYVCMYVCIFAGSWMSATYSFCLHSLNAPITPLHCPLLRLLVLLRAVINCMLIFCMLITANNSYINIYMSVCLFTCAYACVWVAVGLLSLLFNILIRTAGCVSPFQQLKVWNLTLNANVRCVYCKMCAANCKITVLNATIVLSAFFRAFQTHLLTYINEYCVATPLSERCFGCTHLRTHIYIYIYLCIMYIFIYVSTYVNS